MIYQLAQAGQSVQVITIFAGDPPPGPLTPFAQSLHDRWQADAAARRREDLEALRLLGAQAIHLQCADAVYRRDPITGAALYDSEESIFGQVAPADADTIDAIAAGLKAIDPSARLSVPLTAGHHVDHQIVRAAADSLGRELIYYEDYPYAETPERLDEALCTGSWAPEVVRLSDEAIRAKVDAILAYRSQMRTYFKNEREMEQRVRGYAHLVGGAARPAEGLWRLAQRRSADRLDLPVARRVL